MERLLRANGFRSMRTGLPVRSGKDLLVALAISLDDIEGGAVNCSIKAPSVQNFLSPASLKAPAFVEI